MSPKRKVDLDAIVERCQALKLVHAAQCLPELVEEASREDLSPLHFLDGVLVQEIERKGEAPCRHLPQAERPAHGQTLDGYDWTFQPRADRGKLDALAAGPNRMASSSASIALCSTST